MPDADDPIAVTLAVSDAALSDRLATLLATVPGVRLVERDDARSDVTIVASDHRGDGSGAPRDAAVDARLTPRELEVLALIVEGASNKVIARHLGITTHTVKFHVASLLDKLDVAGRAEAITQAVRLGVIHL